MSDEKPTIIGSEDARQGKKSYQVLLVLIVSMILVGIAFMIFMGWSSSKAHLPM